MKEAPSPWAQYAIWLATIVITWKKQSYMKNSLAM